MNTQIIEAFIADLPIACTFNKLINNDYLHLSYNKAFQTMFNKQDSDILGKSMREVYNYDKIDLNRWLHICEDVILEKSTLSIPLYCGVSEEWIYVTVVYLYGDYFLLLYNKILDQSTNVMQLDDLFSKLDMMCITNEDGLILKVNEDVEKVLGYTTDEVLGKNYTDLIHKDDSSNTRDIFKQLKESVSDIKYNARVLCKDGSYRYIEWKSYLYGNLIYSSGRDITDDKKLYNDLVETNRQLIKLTTELKKANASLEKRVITDKMTGFKNRSFFDEQIIKEVKRCEYNGQPISMLIYDIDYFKNINDTFGHLIGDDILRQQSYLIKTLLNKKDIAIRMGGEEFALILPNNGLEQAALLAEKMRFTLENHSFPIVGRVTASFGVAEKLKNESLFSWYKRADNALYEAKNKGRNRIITAGSDSPSVTRIQIRWKDEWNSGNQKIDFQHMELLESAIEIFNNSYLEDSFSKLSVHIEKLLRQIENHFEFEEDVLKKLDYKDMDYHKKLHKELVSRASLLKKDCISGKIKATVLFTFIFDEIILNHLINEDTKFFPLLNDKPGRNT